MRFWKEYSFVCWKFVNANKIISTTFFPSSKWQDLSQKHWKQQIVRRCVSYLVWLPAVWLQSKRIPRTIHRLFCSDENSLQKLLSSLVCKLLYFIRLVVSCLCYKKNIHTFLRFPTCILHRLNITTLRLKITTLWIRLLESLDSQATQT